MTKGVFPHLPGMLAPVKIPLSTKMQSAEMIEAKEPPIFQRVNAPAFLYVRTLLLFIYVY